MRKGCILYTCSTFFENLPECNHSASRRGYATGVTRTSCESLRGYNTACLLLVRCASHYEVCLLLIHCVIAWVFVELINFTILPNEWHYGIKFILPLMVWNSIAYIFREGKVSDFDRDECKITSVRCLDAGDCVLVLRFSRTQRLTHWTCWTTQLERLRHWESAWNVLFSNLKLSHEIDLASPLLM